jgi:microcystin-dependent protein
MQKTAANKLTGKRTGGPKLVGATKPPSLPAPNTDYGYIGEIRMFAAESTNSKTFIPGWLECNGRPLVVRNHQALFDVIGNRFGSPDAGRFNIPDLRGTFVRGWNNGKKANEEGPSDPEAASRTVPAGGPAYSENDHVGSYELDQMRHHNHDTTLTVRWGDRSGNVNGWSSDNGQSSPAFTSPTSEVGGSENRPSNVALIFCIRDPDWNKP